MEDRSEKPIPGRILERRIEKKGLRPRLAAAVIAVLWLIAIVIFGVLEYLVDPETFDSVWDGMWWATQTVTTVGYGDVVPQSTDGRFLAGVLMIGGLSLFAVVTGTITSVFVTRAQEERGRDREDVLLHRIDGLSDELAALRGELSRSSADDPRPPPGSGS